MGRPRKFPAPGEGSPGEQPHPVNVLMSEAMFLGMQEACELDKLLPPEEQQGYIAVSDFVRSAVQKALDEHPGADFIKRQVTLTLEHQEQLQAVRDALRSQLST